MQAPLLHERSEKIAPVTTAADTAPSVRAGGTLLTPVGQLGIRSVGEVAITRISEADARSEEKLTDIIKQQLGIGEQP